MKQKLATLLSWLLALSSAVFPSLSPAKAQTTDKDESVTKQRSEIRWTKSLSKYYAKALISAQYETWGISEFRALKKLWGKESAWDHTADNPKSSAFGIPQIMGMAPDTPPAEQIARGLVYIEHRYGKPSVAWAHWRKHGWY